MDVDVDAPHGQFTMDLGRSQRVRGIGGERGNLVRIRSSN